MRALNSPHRTQPRLDDKGRIVGFRTPIELNAPAGGFHHPHDHHNRVRRERILDGTDVRTTVMLRNIPNKLDWTALKAILDEICFGTYDFVYLRIDFKSACNVGYAFINFADINGMIALIDRLERRTWVGYQTSSKAAEISYATIQGREALIQKFRNSSVMQETPYCRPRLFYTYTEAAMMNQLRKASTEQAFPRPDNFSKLQRSMDSARSIGLYPPHGFSTITEHRNRVSGYDRGTPRDVQQSAMQSAQYRAAPITFTGLTALQKRDIENWYAYTHGNGQVGVIPFDYIPLTHVAQFFADHPPMADPSVPGVIGGQKHSPPRGYRASAGNWRSPAAGNWRSTGDTTPTRGGRNHQTPAGSGAAQRDGHMNNNPFN